MIPPFDEHGNLPPGMHEATWEELFQRFGTTPRRRELLAGLRAALGALAAAGCQRVYLGGSFVTTKDEPLDYDGCWEVFGVDSAVIEDTFLGGDSPAKQKARYLGSLYPVNALVDLTWEFMLEWFQVDRNGNRKGLVVLFPQEIGP